MNILFCRHNLKPLLVHVPVQLKRAKTVSAVVKTSSKFNKLADLKGKKACFSTIEGMGKRISNFQSNIYYKVIILLRIIFDVRCCIKGQHYSRGEAMCRIQAVLVPMNKLAIYLHLQNQLG